jgi:[protein-PII] uridylyltransferase
MANISQRRDMDDPAEIRKFARQMQSLEMLNLLTLHTVADSLATSDKLWNGFKDTLLRELHSRTVPLLAGETEFVRAEEKQREQMMQDVYRRLPKGINDEELHAHFNTLPPRYFQIHTADEILTDLALAHRFMHAQVRGSDDDALAPQVYWHNEPDRGCAEVKVCTWDRAGLFSKIAGSLSATGLTILSAQIFTRSDAMVLDSFSVADAVTGNLPEPAQREKFERLLARLLIKGDVDLHALIAHQKISRPLFQAYVGENLPTQIRLDNDTSETRTIIEIETEDRLGLLYVIAQTLAELELDITTARICTEKGAAIDNLYIHEIGGEKILSPERQKAIERRLRHAIHQLDAAGK